LYVVSRLPKVTETFVVNEWAALDTRFDMFIAALVRTRERPLHSQAAEALRRAWFVSRLSPRTIGSHAAWLRVAPRRYVAVIGELMRAAPRSKPREWLKTVVAFHQAVALAQRAVKTRIDHVHAHFANHPATVAWVVHRLTGIPYSFTAHANDLFRDPVLLVPKIQEAGFVVAISDYNRRALLSRAPDAEIHVVHCGVDTQRFALRPRAARSAGRHVLCVASMERKKGHPQLLHAFAALADQWPDLHLTLIGDGPERPAIERLAASLGVADRVRFLGACSTDDVKSELGAADLFVLPAIRDPTGRMDGIPVALMEAMAIGVPVVTTCVSGIPELVGDDAGVIVPAGNATAVADAITRVFTDDALAAELVRRGRARVEDEFDLRIQAGRLADLFDASARARPSTQPSA
jgi:glycosyltransferase involved in cell wall biosynthesis